MIARTCIHCLAEFNAKPSAIGHRRGGARYCSRSCSALGRTTSKKTLTCVACGKPFTGRVRGATTYCGVLCQRAQRGGDGNPNFRGGPRQLVCQHCSGPFERYGRKPAKFCSSACKAASARKVKPPRLTRKLADLIGTPFTPTPAAQPTFGPGSPPREIPDFPGYLADMEGRIIGRKGPLAPKISARGYPTVALYLHGHRYDRNVHTLVASAWHGVRPSSAHVVAHWDGDRANAAPGNLRWATQRENEADKVRQGRHHRQRLTLEQVHEIRVRLAGGDSASALAARFLVWPQTIYKIRDGRTWART